MRRRRPGRGRGASRAPRCRRSRRSGRSSPRSSCRFPAAPSPARRVRAARSTPTSRACAWQRGGTPGFETTPLPPAPAGPRAGRTGRRPRRCPEGRPSRRSYVASRRVPSATICLPTYNERANIEPMLRALQPLGVNVLVVDDNSPDGTGEIADRLAVELGFVSVLHRKRKEGLGPAYIAGFHRALDDGADLVLEMDCDFSHDPADVPKLIAACKDADLAIGSRYVPGGGTENWGRGRRFVSTGGSGYARTILGG